MGVEVGRVQRQESSGRRYPGFCPQGGLCLSNRAAATKREFLSLEQGQREQDRSQKGCLFGQGPQLAGAQ